MWFLPTWKGVKRSDGKFTHFASFQNISDVSSVVVFSLFNFCEALRWTRQNIQCSRVKKKPKQIRKGSSMYSHQCCATRGRSNCSSSCRLSPVPLPSSVDCWAQIWFPCLSKPTHMPDSVPLRLTFLFWAGSRVQELPEKIHKYDSAAQVCVLLAVLC